MGNIDTANGATVTDRYEFSVHIDDVYSILKTFEQRLYTDPKDFQIDIDVAIADYFTNELDNNITNHTSLLHLGKQTEKNGTTRFYYVYYIAGDENPTKNYCDTVSDIYKFILDMGQQ